MELSHLSLALRGSIVTAQGSTFGSACDDLIWNGRKPAVAPHAIVRAACIEDVQAAVRFAAEKGVTCSPRGTGHNFSGIAVQDGIVIDLSALDAIDIDPVAMTATVGPGVRNGVLSARLADVGLAFPVGHCASVGLSGYLLGGGFGWNSGEWGLACHSIEAAEIVLADGSRVTASATENPALFWALRGGGPEFFGIVVSYRLRLQRLRAGMMTSVRVYPSDRMEEVARWMTAVMAVAPDCLEFTAIVHSAPGATPDSPKSIAVVATVFAQTEADARVALEGVGLWAPANALATVPPMPITYEGLFAGTDPANPAGARYLTEAGWSDDPVTLLCKLAQAVDRAPSSQSYALGCVTSHGFALRPLPLGAFSMRGRSFGALYAVWNNASEDASNVAWLREAADSIGPVTAGHYVGEADLARPERQDQCYAPEALTQLRFLGDLYDPKGLFRQRRAQVIPTTTAIAAE